MPASPHAQAAASTVERRCSLGWMCGVAAPLAVASGTVQLLCRYAMLWPRDTVHAVLGHNVHVCVCVHVPQPARARGFSTALFAPAWLYEHCGGKFDSEAQLQLEQRCALLEPRCS
jgi:hypothetical protein